MSYSWLSAITWKRLLIAVLLISLASYAITLKIEGLRYEKNLKTLESEKRALLDKREQSLNAFKEAYQDTIELKDLEIERINASLDSFDIALSLKDIQLNDIENEVEKMRGDSIGIAYTLTRILSR